MDIDKIRALAKQHLAERKAHKEREKGFIYYHGQRVGAIAVELRRRLFPDKPEMDPLLLVASYFHDVAKGIEPHATYGAVLAKEILRDHCQASELAQICEIIALHQLRDKTRPYSDFVKLVQDADILDHCGTVEIWMNFQYYAFSEGSMEDSLEFYTKHYDRQVKMLRDLLNYEACEQIFAEKEAFVRSFVARMQREVAGLL